MGAVAEECAEAEKDLLGRRGEEIAARYLVEQGYEVLDRNWRCRSGGLTGELDIVARRRGLLVVCEVKTRTGTGFGDPVDAVTRAKAARIHGLAARWLAERHSSSGGLRGWRHVTRLRLDVIGVLCEPNSPVRVKHVEGAV